MREAIVADQQSAEAEYIVAFRYTAAAGGYAGVITWTSYRSKADFDRACAHSHILDKQEILEEGITAERAIALCKRTPASSRLLAALDEATNKEDGSINLLLLAMHLEQALIVIGLDQS